MGKKPLVVMSICAVMFLILGSLSTAVGYQVETHLLHKEIAPSSNQGCDCEKTAGVASWPFPLICGIVGALVVIFTLIVANTDIGNYMLVMLLYLYTVFHCG